MLKQSEGQCAVNIQESNASTPSAKPELSVIAGAQPEMPDISDELMSMFMEMLPESHQNIQQAHLDSDFDALLHHTHKLHGACCYVSLPNLKTALHELESALKSGKTKFFDSLVNDINEAISGLD